MRCTTSGRWRPIGLTLGLALVLSGCQGVRVNTNLAQVVPTVAAQAGVKEYGQSQLNREETAILGALRAEGCLARAPGPQESAAEAFRHTRGRAVAELKGQAVALGGNGIVLHRCQDRTLGDTHCHYLSECEATALLVRRTP
ncbi:hypothetical protein [Ferrimonas balearica]|uniref:hypothetical protein n=1 Tax=Ferrimonas balearica TaxID=44012 RepID=UPI001C9902D2|nr:hypothetical protein [Ferrimonas balearica]MBY5994158.1 hypothetical protein [Ferrimonas balearica]